LVATVVLLVVAALPPHGVARRLARVARRRALAPASCRKTPSRARWRKSSLILTRASRRRCAAARSWRHRRRLNDTAAGRGARS